MVKIVKKNHFIVLIYLTLTIIKIVGGNDEELFLRANQAYEKKDYEAALHLYNSMIQKGRAVLYNTGNCYFYKNDYAHALLYWLRSQQGSTAKEYDYVEHNKRILFQRIEKNIPESIITSIKQIVQKIITCIPLWVFQILFLLFFCIGALCLRSSRMKNKSIIASSSCIVMVIIGYLLSLSFDKHFNAYGIIMQQEAQVFAVPDKRLQSISSLLYCDCVKIKDKREGWYKVEYADIIGWIKSDVIQLV